LKCYDEALHDFIRASQIDPTLASAHTNIGLVHMLYKQNYKVAINYFTTGLTADPVYTRALLCRAEAYTKLGQLHESILDWSRAIHITPDDPTLHLSQGNVYFLLKDYDNAVNCMRIASKLDCEIKSSLTQKALVHSFLGYHEKSISILQQSGLKTIHGRKLYIILGKVQMRAKLYHEASVSFKEALRVLRYMHLSASDEMALTSELHYLCGICFYKCGKLHEATEEFSHVIRIDPTHVLGHYHRGLSLLKQGNNKGMFAINYALMLKSDLIEAYLTRAAYYGSNGRLPKAIMNCTEAINIEPETVRGYLYRGVLRYLMKYNEAAINDLTQAISLNPSNCWIPLFNRAICYTEVENIAEALTNYSTICLMDETPNYKVMINRGLLYLHMEDYYNSLMDLLTANKSITKDPSLYQAIAYCYHKLGDFEKAIYYYTQAITIQPSFIEAYISRGNVYTDYLTPEGNRKAKTDYVKVLHQWPSCLPAHVNLSLLLQCEGQHMMAWKHMTSLLSLNKDYTPALEARSMISFQMGNTFGALLDISEALRYDVNPQYYTERGAIHQYIGDSRNAVLDYERALHLDPNYPLAHYNLGNILLQQGLYKQASQRYTAVINIVPNDDSALINRALCYTAIGEKELALMDLNKASESIAILIYKLLLS
jgi:tetratricopeptide (TPR) repeat protein